jgi:hypothetical protein
VPALAAAAEKPELTLRPAKAATQTSATIEAWVNDKGGEASWEIWLECQEARTPGSHCEPLAATQLHKGVLAPSFGAQTVEAPMTELQPGYLYKYRVVAANAAGREGWVGADFVTCPSSGSCAQPAPGGEALWNVEGAQRMAEEAVAREAERQAKQREAEERPAKEAAERAAREREAREAGERAGREAAERAAAARALLRCVVPRLGGRSLTAARRALARAHCSLGKVTEPRGHHGRLVVGRQSVRSGRKLAYGAKVAVTLRPKRG